MITEIDSILLLMEEILHHLGCINLGNYGINYLSTGAGFLPSTEVYITLVFEDLTSALEALKKIQRIPVYIYTHIYHHIDFSYIFTT